MKPRVVGFRIERLEPGPLWLFASERIIEVLRERGAKLGATLFEEDVAMAIARDLRLGWLRNLARSSFFEEKREPWTRARVRVAEDGYVKSITLRTSWHLGDASSITYEPDGEIDLTTDSRFFWTRLRADIAAYPPNLAMIVAIMSESLGGYVVTDMTVGPEPRLREPPALTEADAESDGADQPYIARATVYSPDELFWEYEQHDELEIVRSATIDAARWSAPRRA